MSNVVTLTLDNEDGSESTHELPAKFEVCFRCEGHGMHLNPSIGNHAYSAEEFYAEFDEDDRREYFKRGGIYDVSCEVCKGQRVVPVVDETRLDAEQKRIHALWKEQEAERKRFDAEWRAEMRHEAMMLGEEY